MLNENLEEVSRVLEKVRRRIFLLRGDKKREMTGAKVRHADRVFLFRFVSNVGFVVYLRSKSRYETKKKNCTFIFHSHFT
jgi:hypothetical protein